MVINLKEGCVKMESLSKIYSEIYGIPIEEALEIVMKDGEECD